MSDSRKLVVTTVPFGAFDPTPQDLLRDAGIEFVINPLGRKLQLNEVADIIHVAEIVIAGTEPITAAVMNACPDLKAICRVGIGLDGVDLTAARERNIKISYTPEAPSPAVAELTIGLMIDMLRKVTKADRDIRAGTWFRKAGRRLSECTVGIIGCGRIGARVARHISGGFPEAKVVANDLFENPDLDGLVTWASKETIYRECDIISLHTPLNAETKYLVSKRELAMFKDNAILINTARGGIVNEADLAEALQQGLLQAAAIDTFEEEPYSGQLKNLDNTVLTCHLGSMTQDCRAQMEIEATQEAIRFSAGKEFLSPVPESEFTMAQQKSV
ncbi:MAG: phosphoglycerate dehydrogenase [Rhodospirillales bacterium]|nr:phosphoglycerate dehydrogenase [Rhodospirillales bacterium]